MTLATEQYRAQVIVDEPTATINGEGKRVRLPPDVFFLFDP